MFTEVVKYVLLYLSGFMSCLLLHRRLQMDVSCLRLIVGTIVTLVWVITSLAPIWKPDYSTPLAVHAIMGSVAGFLFGVEGLKSISFRKKTNGTA